MNLPQVYCLNQAATIKLPQPLLDNEASTKRLPQIASIWLLWRQPQENDLFLLVSILFGSSLTKTGFSSVLKLFEIIGYSVKVIKMHTFSWVKCNYQLSRSNSGNIYLIAGNLTTRFWSYLGEEESISKSVSISGKTIFGNPRRG